MTRAKLKLETAGAAILVNADASPLVTLPLDRAQSADAQASDNSLAASSLAPSKPALDDQRDPVETLDDDFGELEILTKQYVDNLLSRYAGTSSSTSPPLVEQPKPAPSEPARVYKGPTTPPERNFDYRGMRELANYSARDEIRAVDRSRCRRATWGLVAAAFLAILCIVIAALANSVQSTAFQASFVLLFVASMIGLRFCRMARAIERDHAPRC